MAPEDPGAIREGLSRNTEYGSKAHDYGSSDKITDPDGATEILKCSTIISPPMMSTPFIEKRAAFYNSSGLLKQ